MKPTRKALEEAKQHPGGWVLVVDGYDGPSDKVPTERVQGAWKVNDKGEIVGDFVPNPKYRPLEEFN